MSEHDPINHNHHSRHWSGRVLLGGAIATVLLSAFIGGYFGYAGSFLATKGRWPTFLELVHLKTASTTTTIGAGVASTTVEETSATIDATKKVSPSVVSVITKQDLSKLRQQPNNFFYDPFGFFDSAPFQQQQPQKTGKQQVSAGSGFIIETNGLILTNKHVVQDVLDNPDLELTVIFNDGSEHPASIVGSDPLNDIAVLKIDGKNLPVADIGNSDALKLGQTVIAIGNALGEQNTVTRGVVSGINRTVQASNQAGGASETIEAAIQTDAAINHGNSGGPLINLTGQVIGVNTAINESGQNIGFAIPINVAKQVIDSVRQNGKIVRPYLGVRYVLINDTIEQANNLSVNYGALVERGTANSEVAVIPGGPADKAGIVENDILLEFNGKKITEDASLTSFMQKAKIGDSVTIKLLHKGKEKTVTVKLEGLEQKPTTAASTNS